MLSKETTGCLVNTCEFVGSTLFQVRPVRNVNSRVNYEMIANYLCLLSSGRPVDTCGNVDYVPSVFAYRKRANVHAASVRQMEEHQKRVDKRRQMADERDKENQEDRNVHKGRQPVQGGPLHTGTQTECVVANSAVQTEQTKIKEAATQTLFVPTSLLVSVMFLFLWRPK